VTTLVKRGTARRLGLRQPGRQWAHVGLFQFAMPTEPYVPPVDGHLPPYYGPRLSNRLPKAPDGIVYTGERSWP
jgi:hypothetical protein